MRIDKFLSEKYGSRTKAAEAVIKKLVIVNDKTVSPSYNVKPGDDIQFIEAEENFVSAGGFKLSKALKDFGYSPQDKIFADIGASTGGFTDCLLQNGAKKVYCIDVGESQLDKRLNKENVVVIDNYNARELNKGLFSEVLDGAVIDVSFISLTYILGGVSKVLDEGATVIALIKPQFECENRKVGKNGIVKDPKIHEAVIRKIYDFAISCGLQPQKITNAPIVQGKNLEHLIMFSKSSNVKSEIEYLLKSVKL